MTTVPVLLTGGVVTVIATDLLNDPPVAVMLAVPAATPVTTPLASTVANSGWSVDQVIVGCGETAFLFTSSPVACSVIVLPISTVLGPVMTTCVSVPPAAY